MTCRVELHPDEMNAATAIEGRREMSGVSERGRDLPEVVEHRQSRELRLQPIEAEQHDCRGTSGDHEAEQHRRYPPTRVAFRTETASRFLVAPSKLGGEMAAENGSAIGLRHL